MLFPSFTRAMGHSVFPQHPVIVPIGKCRLQVNFTLMRTKFGFFSIITEITIRSLMTLATPGFLEVGPRRATMRASQTWFRVQVLHLDFS